MGADRGGRVTRLAYQKQEAMFLAPYAMKSAECRGREHPEKEHDLRTPFQRDRDRIIHSTAFRRLEYKTQVFVNHEGDHYRTRLTHTLETCQIARTMARTLRLNEDLTEAVGLAHDLGHGPFGHAGEWALAELMKAHGGFEHNVQSLRIVEKLEESYAEFKGLNLTFETREGMKKHPERFKEKKSRFRTLEAEVADLADEIAYNSHDLDDGLRAELLAEEQIGKLRLWQDAVRYIRKRYPDIAPVQRKRLAIRLIVNRLVLDATDHTLRQIEKLGIHRVGDLQKAEKWVVGFSKETAAYVRELKAFLQQNLYHHYRVERMTEKAQRFLKAIFNTYLGKPTQLPPDVTKRSREEGLHRSLCDYVAGMTDRFALDEYQRFFEPYERV